MKRLAGRFGMGNAGMLVLVLSALAGPASAAGACSPVRVDLRGPGGAQSFAVEVADTGALRAKGLMNRENLPADSGMLFIYETPRRASFWMENTLIPLDMIFADQTGRVTRVHDMAVPLDRTSIDGGEGVQFVLEINGGLAEKLGIVPGTELRHPAIGEDAAWPCN